MFGWLTDLLAPWSAYYGDHAAVSGAIRYLHLAGIMVGGGTALAADRLVIMNRGSSAGRDRILAALEDAHRIVVPSLAAIGITGVLMFAADTETFTSSPTYWLKMLTVVLLAANGAGLQFAERRVRANGSSRSWSLLARTAQSSTVLWLLVLLMGVWLTFSA